MNVRISKRAVAYHSLCTFDVSETLGADDDLYAMNTKSGMTNRRCGFGLSNMDITTKHDFDSNGVLRSRITFCLILVLDHNNYEAVYV